MKLQQVTTFLWQWGWLILLGTAVAAGTAYLINANMTPVYQAAATWLIDEPAQNEAQNQATAGNGPATTYAALLLTRPVLAETIVRLDLPLAVEQLQARVTAVSPDNNRLITIQVEDANPEDAERIADTLGAVLADQTAARDGQRFAAPLANWQQQIDASSTEIAALKTQLAAAEPSDRPQLEARLTQTQARYDEAFSQYNALLAEQARESVAFMPIETAQATAAPIRPRTAVATIGAAAAGALTTLLILAAASRFGVMDERSLPTAVPTNPVPLTSND